MNFNRVTFIFKGNIIFSFAWFLDTSKVYRAIYFSTRQVGDVYTLTLISKTLTEQERPDILGKLSYLCKVDCVFNDTANVVLRVNSVVAFVDDNYINVGDGRFDLIPFPIIQTLNRVVFRFEGNIVFVFALYRNKKNDTEYKYFIISQVRNVYLLALTSTKFRKPDIPVW